MLALGFHPCTWMEFIKVKFRKITLSDIKSGNYIMTENSAIFDLHPSANRIKKETYRSLYVLLSSPFLVIR